MTRSSFRYLVLAFALAACTEPATQLTVVTASDLPAESRACVRIEARPLDVAEVTASNAIDRPDMPFSFGVAPPGGDPKRNVEVRVSAFPSCDLAEDPAATPVVARRVRTGFVEGATLRLDVFLASRCRDVVCSDEQTCAPDTGMCEDIPFVDPKTLTKVTPGAEFRDAGPPATGPCTPLATRVWYPLTTAPATAVPSDLAARRTDSGLEWISASGGENGIVAHAIAADGTNDREILRIMDATYNLTIVPLPSPNVLVLAASPVGGVSRVRRTIVPEVGAAVESPLVLGYLQGTDDVGALLDATPVVMVDEQGVGEPSNLYTASPTGGSSQVVVDAVDRFSPTLTRRADGGILIARGTATACEVMPVSPTGMLGSFLSIPAPGGCGDPGIAELADGRIALVAEGTTLVLLVVSPDLVDIRAMRDLGPGTKPAVVGLPDGSMRVAWVTDVGIATLRAAADAALTLGPLTMLDAEGATPVDREKLQLAVDGSATAITFAGRPAGTPSMMLSVVCN